MNTNPRKSHKYKPTAYLILSILWILLIFSFSAQPATESTKTSLRVGMTVGSVLVPDFSSMSEIDRTKYAESIEFPVRKTAMRRSMQFLVFYLQPLCHPLKKDIMDFGAGSLGQAMRQPMRSISYLSRDGAGK